MSSDYDKKTMSTQIQKKKNLELDLQARTKAQGHFLYGLIAYGMAFSIFPFAKFNGFPIGDSGGNSMCLSLS